VTELPVAEGAVDAAELHHPAIDKRLLQLALQAICRLRGVSDVTLDAPRSGRGRR
jgi:hypothetical protein